jgi:uncharacterized SAM-binding protein YcdF (DUF218 family)
VVALGTTLLGVGGLGFFSLPWLLITSLPTDAAHLPVTDVIIHWASMPRSQADDWVAQLYQQGKAKQIVCVSTPVSWDVYAADFARQHLLALGVPAEKVLTLRLEQEACIAPNIKRVAAYVKEQGWQSALVVTEPITASSRLEKYFQQEGVKLALSYAPQDRAELTHNWWRTHWKMQVMIEAVVTMGLDSVYAECR